MKTITIPCLGYSLTADWYAGKNPHQILLSLIGWTSNRQRYSDILTTIVEQTGMSALVFDYSGHGDSLIALDETRPAQHFLEVITVFDQLRQDYSAATISVMGTSYGGFMATQLTKYREFEKLVLRVPAIYRPEDFYTLNKWRSAPDATAKTDAYRRDLLALRESPLLARAARFKGKTLVVVHENDEQVPAETTAAYIDAFGAEKYLAKGFGHSIHGESPAAVAEYAKVISDWLKK